MAGDVSVHNNNNTTSSNNINRGEERGLTPEARAGAVQSPRKHNRTGEEGCWGRLRGRRRAEERRKNGVGGPSAGVRSPPPQARPRHSPVHGASRTRGGEKSGSEALFWSAGPQPPQPGSDHGEQRAHFRFGDVTRGKTWRRPGRTRLRSRRERERARVSEGDVTTIEILIIGMRRNKKQKIDVARYLNLDPLRQSVVSFFVYLPVFII